MKSTCSGVFYKSPINGHFVGAPTAEGKHWSVIFSGCINCVDESGGYPDNSDKWPLKLVPLNEMFSWVLGMISNHQPFESEGRTQLGNCSDSHLPKLLRNFFSQSRAEKSSMCRFVISFLDLVGVNFPALRRDMFPLFHLTTLEKRRLSHSATKIVMIYDSSRFHHISYHISSCFITIIAIKKNIKKRHPSEIWSPFSITGVTVPATSGRLGQFGVSPSG